MTHNTILLSIIITTYNRITLVEAALDSALQMIREINDSEIVIIDDCSQDWTSMMIRQKYCNELSDETVKLIELPRNYGVTGAKNAGARHAKGEWLMFLDSDDVLVSGCGTHIQQDLKSCDPNCPVIFYRCRDKAQSLIGPHYNEDFQLTLKAYLRTGGPSECLPVVRKNAFCNYYYDEDLRGFEGLTYSKLLKTFGPALVSTIVARIYCDEENIGRLSTRSGIKKRAHLLAIGNARLLRLFPSELGMGTLIKTFIKTIYYSLHAVLYRLKTIFKNDI